MQDLLQAACNGADHSHQVIALWALNDFVAEMNPSTASSLGLPWAVHERCRAQLAQDDHSALLRMFCTASDALTRSAAGGADGVVLGVRRRAQLVALA